MNTNLENKSTLASVKINWDSLLPAILLNFIQKGKGTRGMIQRKYCIGYVRTGIIIDQMVNAGFISKENENDVNYKVLITKQDYQNIFENK